MIKTCRFLFAGIIILFASDVNAQSKSESYLFHFNPFRQEQAAGPRGERRVKVRLHFGLMSEYIQNSPNYPNYISGAEGDPTPYTIGLKIEIPVQHNADIIVGPDLMHGNFDFDSYFFAPAFSHLYNGDLNFDHTILMDELQIPVLYKINFGSESRNVRNLYATFGWIFRYILYNNAEVTDISNGGFVWEGQNDITFAYPLFTPQASGAIEASLGYQHNTLRNGNAWFLEIEYRYGVSPLIYTGNQTGSNYVEFTLNTLSFKFGLRL